MITFLNHISLAAPLFVLVFVGYGLMHWGQWPQTVSQALSRFVFSVALPALLFHLMSDLSKLPPVDARLLIAFFGACLIVFAIGRLVAAKDMDILRAALGEAKLHYLGKSYGTFLGSTYAGLFPAKVGRFVLDGVVPPDLTSSELSQGQARGFEEATRAYVANCIKRSTCPVGSTVDEGMQWLRDFLKGLDGQPIRVTTDAKVTELNEAWAAIGLANAMYSQQAWPSLTSALIAAQNGDGDELMDLANQYADRTSGGTYAGNIMEVIYAVNCLDRPDTADLTVIEKNADAFAQVAPTWGRFLAWGSVPCGVWPIQTGNTPAKITAAGSGPIVIVGTTRDPATIYEWSVRLRGDLANSVLLTFDGDGHTAYTRSNSCIDKPIDDYYVKGIVPTDGLKC